MVTYVGCSLKKVSIYCGVNCGFSDRRAACFGCSVELPLFRDFPPLRVVARVLVRFRSRELCASLSSSGESVMCLRPSLLSGEYLVLTHPPRGDCNLLLFSDGENLPTLWSLLLIKLRPPDCRALCGCGGVACCDVMTSSI